ncbi:MAG TPA: response regulator [Thermomicrobiales bacterium]|nr:response regulator [Thermomicrobiales bacterium]
MRMMYSPDDESYPMSLEEKQPEPRITVLDDDKRHILVINDTQEILELFRELLEDEGYRVTLSSFAMQEIRDVVALAPDLVILDFIIGGEAHGWQMLQKMKMNRATATIPVIVCTAALQLVREIEGHLRAKDVLVVLKPFDIDDLLEAVSLALSKLAQDCAEERV